MYLPNGHYLLDSSALAYTANGQQITGAGEGATIITIGASFSGTAAIECTGYSDCGISGVTIQSSTGAWSTAAAANGVEVAHAQRFRMTDVRGYALNGWLAEILSDGTGDSFYPVLNHVTASFCASGVHLKGSDSSDHLMAAYLVNCTFEECEDGDGLFCEDVTDVTCVNLECSPAPSPSGGGTPGSSLHIKGVCASHFYTNADLGGLVSSAPNTVPTVLIESSGAGSPFGIFITSSIAEFGTPGVSVTAGSQITLNGVQINSNDSYGFEGSGSAGIVNLLGCLFDGNNYSGGAGAYDLFWNSTGKILCQNSIFATPSGSSAGQVAERGQHRRRHRHVDIPGELVQRRERVQLRRRVPEPGQGQPGIQPGRLPDVAARGARVRYAAAEQQRRRHDRDDHRRLRVDVRRRDQHPQRRHDPGVRGAGGAAGVFPVDHPDLFGHGADLGLVRVVSVYTPAYGPVYGGGFPLDLKLALQLGGTWTDVTQYAYNRTTPAFTITRGRPDETSQVSPSQMTGQLNNRDGRFTSRNPAGPYYGQLGRNTPVRLSVPDQFPALRIEDDTVSAAGTTAFPAITGDIDVRLEMDLSGWMPCNLISNWDNWALVLNGDGTLGWWIDQSSVVTVVASTMPVVPGHGAVRVTRATSTGVVTFYTSDTISGTWTQLGDAVTSVTGDLDSGSHNLTVGYDSNVTGQDSDYGGPSGRFYDAQVLSGIGGTLEAEPAFNTLTAGTTSWTDAQGNSWSCFGASSSIDDRSYRYHGEMSSLPVAWDPSGRDIWVPFTAGGVLRRLQQGTSSVSSAMRRAVAALTGTAAPGRLLAVRRRHRLRALASGLPGAPAMSAGPGITLRRRQFVRCSAALPPASGRATWSGRVPGYSGGTAIRRPVPAVPPGACRRTTLAAMSSRTAPSRAAAELHWPASPVLIDARVRRQPAAACANTGGPGVSVDGETVLVVAVS